MLKNLPEWIVETISNFKCPQCNNKMDAESIKGLGIRESHRDDSQTVLFLYYFCKNCQERTNIEIQSMTLEEFAVMIFEEANADLIDEEEGQVAEDLMEEAEETDDVMDFGVPNKKESDSKKTKITNKEFQDTIRKLKNMTRDDFTRDLGIIVPDKTKIED